MGDLLISALMVGDCSDRLCVRACRTWDFYDLEDQTKLLHTDLVLLGEEVCITYVEISPTLLIASTLSLIVSFTYSFFYLLSNCISCNSYLPGQGSSIHAPIYPPLTEKFRPLLQEGKVCNISFIQIKKANRMYKPVENDIMISFTRWSTVEEVVEIPPAFPMLRYSLTPIVKLPSLVDSKEYFTGRFL
jgi:replication factor A1